MEEHQRQQPQLSEAAIQALSQFPRKICENVIGLLETFYIGTPHKHKKLTEKKEEIQAPTPAQAYKDRSPLNTPRKDRTHKPKCK